MKNVHTCLDISLFIIDRTLNFVCMCLCMCVCACVCICVPILNVCAEPYFYFVVLPYEFIGSDFVHTCADRDHGKAPCLKKSYSISRNTFPWIDYACSDPLNAVAVSTCAEMTSAFSQYYFQSTE